GRRVAARLGHSGQRRDLRAPPVGLRRGRPALRARPLASVPHGPARTPGGLRAAGPRLRAPDPDERERVPAQGADVRALVAHRAARADVAPPAARLPSRARLAPSPALREWALASHPARALDRVARPRRRLRGAPRSSARAARGGS